MGNEPIYSVYDRDGFPDWWQGDAWLLLPPLYHPCEEWEGLRLLPMALGKSLLVYEDSRDGSHILWLYGHIIRSYLYKGDQNSGVPAACHC